MMNQEELVPDNLDLDLNKPEDQYEEFNRRILLNERVRKYIP